MVIRASSKDEISVEGKSGNPVRMVFERMQ